MDVRDLSAEQTVIQDTTYVGSCTFNDGRGEGQRGYRKIMAETGVL